MIQITSRNNPKIKQTRLLRQRKYRQETGQFLVEGIHAVGQAVEAVERASTGLVIDSIYYTPELLTSEFALNLVETQSRLGVPCYSTTAEVFEHIADKENPQGILAVARLPKVHLAHISPQRFPWMVALVTPQDPGNIGTILRTIDAVGASGLILLDASADPYHPSSVRASMGSIFWHPVVQASFDEFVTWAKGWGYLIYGTSAKGNTDYRQVRRYDPPAILLLGSEQRGLSPEQMAACYKVLRLPMRGRMSSLNLAVAAGVLLYHMLENIQSENIPAR